MSRKRERGSRQATAGKAKHQPEQGRRNLLKGGAIWFADKVAGNAIGLAMGGALTKYASTCPTRAVVVSTTATAVVIAATGAFSVEGQPAHLYVSGPGGIRAAERDADSHRDTGGSPLPMF